MLSLLLTSLTLPFVIPLLRKRGVLDVPRIQSSHDFPTPRGAGFALAIGMLLSLIAVSQLATAAFVAIAGFATLGAWDDVRSLPARHRLAVQLLVSCAVALSLGSTQSPLPVMAFAVLVVTATTNAVNFMDGINGITALHAVIWGIAFAWLLRDLARPELSAFALALAGAGAAFLPWNTPRARAFLGDSGSYLIGSGAGLLAVVSVPAIGPVAALCPLAIYAADTGSTLIRRVRTAEPVTQAHRDHTYQRLVRSGWSHARTATVVAAFTLGTTFLGIASVQRGPLVQAVLVIGAAGLCTLFLTLPRLVNRTGHRLVGARHA
jgi:UDP-N-acetylmuramyl pentapeptide phosphotransferase/UDP-N-acetylglucosamine-1-phosphate transferase